MIMKRRLTNIIKVGNVLIGGGNPVVIQSMTNTKTSDTVATLEQICQLAEAGCELVRLAIPDKESAGALKKIVPLSPVPLIADIHFDVTLAYHAIDSGAAKIRINPGNIGSPKKLVELVVKAESNDVPLRIGVNAGSLEKNLLRKYGGATSNALVESALGFLKTLESTGFQKVIVSLKASDVPTTINAYRMISSKTTYPLHLGITGAGPVNTGTVKAAVGLGTLLAEGIGDTIRVSLTASPLEEVRVAKQILQALELRRFGPDIISCPTCGRCEVDLVKLVAEVEEILSNYHVPLKIAVMGCVVNGPGEAREADLGITAGRKKGILFKQGQVIRTVSLDSLLDALTEELESYIEQNS